MGYERRAPGTAGGRGVPKEGAGYPRRVQRMGRGRRVPQADTRYWKGARGTRGGCGVPEGVAGYPRRARDARKGAPAFAPTPQRHLPSPGAAHASIRGAPPSPKKTTAPGCPSLLSEPARPSPPCTAQRVLPPSRLWLTALCRYPVSLAGGASSPLPTVGLLWRTGGPGA